VTDDQRPDIDTFDGDESEEASGNVADPVEQARPHANDAEAVEALRGLVKYVVDNLVDHPEQAEIVVEQRGNVVALGVRLPEEELGKVIGRGGRIAKSIRTALMVAGSQHHLRVSLDIDATDTPAETVEIDGTEVVVEPGS
jgi:predicted RNA-binding protein YlqC (UPF0109 family)